jgi:hypothetical protein
LLIFVKVKVGPVKVLQVLLQWDAVNQVEVGYVIAIQIKEGRKEEERK